MMRSPILRAMIPLLLLVVAHADSGVLIPKDKEAPDPAVLSLAEMRVNIVIDNGDAHVSIVQIFENHSDAIEEGTYRFALPGGATVSDFAVWDGPVRIPAVILERRRAGQIYDQARLQAIDPGLLAAGERDSSDPRSSAVFTAKIVPIPPHGTKRLELEYHQRIATNQLQQSFALALKPDAAQSQTAAHFTLHLTLRSAHPLQDFAAASALFPLKFTSNDAHTVEAAFNTDNLAFTDDFQATWKLSLAGAASSNSDQLQVITYRDPATPLPDAGTALDAGDPSRPHPPEPGFFDAQLLVANPSPPPPSAAAAPRTLILLFDNSLSMQWEKLERSYAALEATLRSPPPVGPVQSSTLQSNHYSLQNRSPSPQTLPPSSRPLTSSAPASFAVAPISPKPLRPGLAQTSSQTAAPETFLALFTDGGSDRGDSVLPGKIAAQYAARWKQSPHPPHTCIFAVGDDANLPLLRALAHQGGFLESVLSAEPVDLHLKTFVSRLTLRPLAGPHAHIQPCRRNPPRLRPG